MKKIMDSNNYNNKQIQIKTIEMHNAGHPLRIIESGYPHIDAKTILQKQAYCKEKLDNYRKLIILEPRGQAALVALLLVEPDHDDADIAILLLDKDGYFNMCGDAVITISRYALDKGIIRNPTSPETKVKVQLPCGLVESSIEYSNGKTGKVRFQTVPAFALALDVAVQIDGLGEVRLDIGYGGTFFIVVAAKTFGIEARNGNIEKLIQIGMKVQAAVSESVNIEHPEIPDLSLLYGVIFTDGNDQFSQESTTHVVTNGVEQGQAVRSPCGSATTARVAIQHARGQITKGQCRSFKSGISGCIFTGKVQEVTKCGAYDAVIVEICGQGSRYIGTATYTLEEQDEFQQGLTIN